MRSHGLFRTGLPARRLLVLLRNADVAHSLLTHLIIQHFEHPNVYSPSDCPKYEGFVAARPCVDKKAVSSPVQSSRLLFEFGFWEWSLGKYRAGLGVIRSKPIRCRQTESTANHRIIPDCPLRFDAASAGPRMLRRAAAPAPRPHRVRAAPVRAESERVPSVINCLPYFFLPLDALRI
jgi:hypothetical protein